LVTIDSDPDPDQAQYKVEIRGERLDPELFFSDAFVFHGEFNLEVQHTSKVKFK
jgi:hypothetical protein